MSGNSFRFKYLDFVDSWKVKTFPYRIVRNKSAHRGNSMSCLPDCGCSRTPQETDSTVAQVAHDETSYQPLSEASYVSEAIPLLPKDSTMRTYEADSSHYTLLAIIGKGLNDAATVVMARHIPTNQHIAVRKINLEECMEDITYVQKEILVTRQLRHTNILPYYSAFVHSNEVWVIMPLLAYGSTRDIIYSHFPSGLPEMAIALIMKDVLLALEYVHKRGFIHRSVKASHILISSAGHAVLSGFRYSCNVICNGKWKNTIHSFPQDSIINLHWLSPELLEQNLRGYSAKSDVYSLGITACELANGIVPFADMLPTQILLEKQQGYSPRPMDVNTFFPSEDDDISNEEGYDQCYRTKCFSRSFHDFTEISLLKDPNKRPSSSQLLSHAFVKQTKKTNFTLQDILAVVTPLQDLSPNQVEDERNSSPEQLQIENLSIEEPWNF